MLTLEDLCERDYVALVFNYGVFKIDLLALACFEAHALMPFLRISRKDLTFHALDLNHCYAGGQYHDIVNIRVYNTACCADGEKGVCHNGKFTEIRDKKHACRFFTCSAIGKYLSARRKGADLYRELPHAECDKNENYAHYKRDEFFHYAIPFK